MQYDQHFLRVVELYRALHRVPELGFELPKTLAIVKSELESCGIAYTEQYGKGSVVAELGKGKRCIALRADMDALPIEEKSGVPFASEHPGKMHACGHDSHTAILLGVARCLKVIEEQLCLRVRLVFQPSEECAISGAEMMVNNGVMEGVDQILATHCEEKLPAGELGVCAGDYMAACIPLRLTFFGKAAHATLPEEGVDAIAMANTAYSALAQAVSEEAAGRPYIWSVGRISGGTAHNIISDTCEMDISFRFYDGELAAKMEKRTRDICDAIAQNYGGSYALDWHISTGAVINHPQLAKEFLRLSNESGIRVQALEPRMASEDFGWYLTKAPGLLFRYGICNGAFGSGKAAHTCDFKVYAPAMKTALRMFVEYVLCENRKETEK